MTSAGRNSWLHQCFPSLPDKRWFSSQWASITPLSRSTHHWDEAQNSVCCFWVCDNVMLQLSWPLSLNSAWGGIWQKKAIHWKSFITQFSELWLIGRTYNCPLKMQLEFRILFTHIYSTLCKSTVFFSFNLDILLIYLLFSISRMRVQSEYQLLKTYRELERTYTLCLHNQYFHKREEWYM